MVVPFPPGGATDILARVVGKRLAEVWSQNVIIDNRPGAGGTLGANLVAKANADGYTLLMGTNASHAIAPSLYANLAYDPLKDFAPITLVAIVPQVVVVHPALPVKNIRELIALAKQKPGTLNFSSAGQGTPGHLGMELFKMMTGTSMIHVPYQGGAPGLAAVAGGQVQFMADNMNSALPFIQAGRVRAIGVTSAKRSGALPDMPTIAEQGVTGFDSGSWFGMFAPAGTPATIVAKLHAETVKTLQLPDVKQTLAQQGAEVGANTPAQFTELIKSDIARWAKVIQAAGVKVN
ncbi:MAG: tripartite tricarboxylate transporter substrate binding protein [Burkholderiales bacterium]|nr:tripartite tricarboxylate transporter substrate binding protein [Burkholderiales bacterium]